MSAAQSPLVPINRAALPAGVPDWTVEAIDARRRTGDVLVTRDGWSVSFDTSSETGKVARLSCVKYGPGMSLVVLERDARDGEVFPTTEDAECYALNAGRLQWYRDWKDDRRRAALNAYAHRDGDATTCSDPACQCRAFDAAPDTFLAAAIRSES